MRLCETLSVSPGYLFGADWRWPLIGIVRGELGEPEAAVLSFMSKLSPMERQRLADGVAAIVAQQRSENVPGPGEDLGATFSASVPAAPVEVTPRAGGKVPPVRPRGSGSKRPGGRGR